MRFAILLGWRDMNRKVEIESINWIKTEELNKNMPIVENIFCVCAVLSSGKKTITKIVERIEKNSVKLCRFLKRERAKYKLNECFKI